LQTISCSRQVKGYIPALAVLMHGKVDEGWRV
jgi:hypothetical protein